MVRAGLVSGLFANLVSGAGRESFCRQFHSSGAQLVRQKHLKRLNRVHKHWAKQLFKESEEWVDPVLGRPGTPFLARLRAVIGQPENQLDSLEPEATSKILLGAERALLTRPLATPASGSSSRSNIGGSVTEDAGEDNAGLQVRVRAHQADEAARKREAVLRIVSLQNASQTQVQKQAVALARNEFQRFEGDTGSPEVQAAVSTVRIHFVAAHAKETKKDLVTKRRLEHMVQTRRNILIYLKRKDPRRYIWAIEKLGLSDAAVSEEFHMSRRYLWRTQFYGDKTLPLKKTVKDTKKARELAAKRSKAERYLAQHDPEALMRIN